MSDKVVPFRQRQKATRTPTPPGKPSVLAVAVTAVVVAALLLGISYFFGR